MLSTRPKFCSVCGCELVEHVEESGVHYNIFTGEKIVGRKNTMLVCVNYYVGAGHYGYKIEDSDNGLTYRLRFAHESD